MDKESLARPAVQKGRPRGFDAAEALDKALHVFWQRGYEGTSLSDLTEAMGINRPSLYAAFGNKEELFRRALDRYAEKGPGAVYRKALAEPTARAVVERLLKGVAEFFTEPKQSARLPLRARSAVVWRSGRIDKKRTMSSSRRGRVRVTRTLRARQNRRRSCRRRRYCGTGSFHLHCDTRYVRASRRRRITRRSVDGRGHGHEGLAQIEGACKTACR